jgi:hypothetical protein
MPQCHLHFQGIPVGQGFCPARRASARRFRMTGCCQIGEQLFCSSPRNAGQKPGGGTEAPTPHAGRNNVCGIGPFRVPGWTSESAEAFDPAMTNFPSRKSRISRPVQLPCFSGRSFSRDSPARDHLQEEVIRDPGRTNADAEIELPLRAQVQICYGEDLLRQCKFRIARNAPVSAETAE